MRYEPLRVTFALASPVVLSYPWISLDGYLAYETGLEKLGQDAWQDYQTKDPSPIWEDLPVPLAKVRFSHPNNNNDFYYQSSIGRFENPQAVSSRKLQKMFCGEGMNQNATKKEKYIIVGGEFKLRSIKYPSNYSRAITFWCKGDVEKVQAYCANIHGLGLRVAAGNGRVSSCKVERAPSEDYAEVHPLFGLNRPIPIANYDLHDPWGSCVVKNPQALLSYKPPYWAKKNHVLCYVPGGIGI